MKTPYFSRLAWLEVGIFAIILGGWLCLEFIISEPSLTCQPSPLWEDIRLIRFALAMYRADYEALPYDPRGPGFALYKIKPYLEKSPRLLPPSVWDQDNERIRIEATPIHYVNGNVGPDKIVLWVPYGNGRLCIMSDLLEITYRDDVGKR